MKKSNILICLALLLISASISAEVTPMFNYQGRLVEPDGTPYSGTHSITLNIYDVETGGTALRGAVYSREVKNGYYNIQFGAEPIMDISTLPFDKQYYLGVRVDGLTEMTPRKKLGSVAYAMRAQTAVQAESATIAAMALAIANNTVDATKIVDGSIGGLDIADGAIDQNKAPVFPIMNVNGLLTNLKIVGGTTSTDGGGWAAIDISGYGFTALPLVIATAIEGDADPTVITSVDGSTNSWLYFRSWYQFGTEHKAAGPRTFNWIAIGK